MKSPVKQETLSYRKKFINKTFVFRRSGIFNEGVSRSLLWIEMWISFSLNGKSDTDYFYGL